MSASTRIQHAVTIAVVGSIAAGAAALVASVALRDLSAERPAGGTLLYRANASSGTSDWCFVHSAVAVGPGNAPDGTLAFRAETQDGRLIDDAERSEYANGPGACFKHKFSAGSETWTRVRVFLAADFPSYDSWSVIVQWKEPFGGTPPSQIALEREAFAIRGVGSETPRAHLGAGPIARGEWIEFVVHHKWSPDPTEGFVEVYRDGALVVPLTHLKTMENTNPLFLSVGQYRDNLNSGTAVLWIDEVRVGTTRESVN